MLLDLFLGLHMDTFLKSNREFGAHMGAAISETSSIGVQFSSGSTNNKLDSVRYDIKYETQTLFYRYHFLNGWLLKLNAIKREAHEKIGIITTGTPYSDVIPTFDDRMDIDAESYLMGASLGYGFDFANSSYLDITVVEFALPAVSRSWSTLEVMQDSGTSGIQKVQDAADRFAQQVSKEKHFGYLKISVGIKF